MDKVLYFLDFRIKKYSLHGVKTGFKISGRYFKMILDGVNYSYIA